MYSKLGIFPITLMFGCFFNDNDPSEQVDGAQGDGLQQAEACAVYLDCLEHMGERTDLHDGVYGPHGECWQEGQQEALACTEYCDGALLVEHATDPTVEACWPGDTPDTELLFLAVPYWGGVDKSCDWDTYQFHLMTLSFVGNEDGVRFSASGDIGGIWFFDNVECTLEGHDFSCEPHSVDWAWELHLAGSFEADFNKVYVDEVVHTWDESELSCSHTLSSY